MQGRDKCTKKHTLDCPDFSRTGECPRGVRCRMVHRRRREKRRHAEAAEAGEETGDGRERRRGPEAAEEPAASPRTAEGDSDCEEEPQESSEEEPPRKVAKLPSFISLRDQQPAETTEKPASQGQEKLPDWQPGSQSESRAPAEQVAERLQIRPRFLARPRKGAAPDGPAGE
ncbi:ZC3H3 [Branchiostoma lanceolatum]|uniref:ZC3H3 protein n=1 Tax=Branchiostoma lanceolatum TaxID=7740 RepID=A0A8K0A865_BRALA|nr:ZC3H3 [Branchiostoma lanceolatum]